MEVRFSTVGARKSFCGIGAVALAALLLLPLPTFPDIGKTKHNLARDGGAGISSRGESSAICVFCHTPMVVGQDVVSPEWRRSMRVAAPFLLYDNIGRAGRDGDVFVGSTSLVCLSCHDGSQAPNIVKNDYNHPFGVPYKGLVVDLGVGEDSRVGLPPVAPHSIVSTAISAFVEDFRPAVQGTIDNRKVWWVPAGGTEGLVRRTKHDLPLYGHEVELGGEKIPYVECASCHDPHSESRAFLRIGSSGSRLCLTCHDK